MAFEALKRFFRDRLGIGGGTSTNKSGIKVWMPQFINEVEENTDLLLKTASRLRASARKIIERRKAREERREKLEQAKDFVRGIFT